MHVLNFIELFVTFAVPEPVYLIASLKRVNLSHNQITEVSTLMGKNIFLCERGSEQTFK